MPQWHNSHTGSKLQYHCNSKQLTQPNNTSCQSVPTLFRRPCLSLPSFVNTPSSITREELILTLSGHGAYWYIPNGWPNEAIISLLHHLCINTEPHLRWSLMIKQHHHHLQSSISSCFVLSNVIIINHQHKSPPSPSTQFLLVQGWSKTQLCSRASWLWEALQV